ncbi:MAG: KpsF/GutQ family sugar-phosphate isomerase [Bacteroidales bacterium]|jgi:arabinose-5-phosphate isomerase|nr:KpsF/GutQ family sugar-phosphate isomerase [Bacteroidales bacterium]
MGIKEIAIQCIEDESRALLDLIPSINDDFVKIIELIYNCKGELIVTGVGKSGHIGAKIASTLASTGTPSFFVNPLDAFHGDLGMVSKEDIVLAISNSGQTDELLRFIPYLLKRQIPIISMSGNPKSLLAKYSLFHIYVGVSKEADLLNLVPTSSTTVQLVMGDAIVCALIEKRGFEAHDYAMFHPGGSLGKRLLMRVSDVMFKENLPIVTAEYLVSDTLPIMTKGKLGLVIILENNKVMGLMTSGDLRYGIQAYKTDFLNMKITQLMNPHPITIDKDAYLLDAEKLFSETKLTMLIVVNSDGTFAGILDIRECQI